jgi:hypothetical protein
MPKTKHDLLKRQLAQAYYHLNQSGTFISRVEDQFRPDHPELADGLIAALGLITAVQQVMDTFVEAAWGTTTPAWESWRNPNKHDKSPLPTREEIKDEFSADV